MKYLVIVFLFVVSVVNAQDAAQSESPAGQQLTAGQIFSLHYARTYQAAVRYNDYDIARHALYNILVENPQNDSILYSLSLLYYQSQNYASAALTAMDVIALNPNNISAKEIAAISFESIGAKDKALEQYESLYLATDNFQTLYKMAFLQYDLQKYAESVTNADILLTKKEAEELTAAFNDEAGNQKEYPIKVALMNLKGLIAQEQGDNASAESYYKQVLSIAPDFKMAKDALADLKK